jgi:dimethylargininase
MPIALVRDVSPSIVRCELTHLERVPISYERAAAQHEAYVDRLASLGCVVERLPALPEAPDAVFVEDTAIVLRELAVITRPGAPSRRLEVDSTATALARFRTFSRIEAPGTIDGGDVLVHGRTVYVGASSRSNIDGIGQLRAIVEPAGYEVRAVPLRDCLHLKSAASFVGDGILLSNPAWVDPFAFDATLRMSVDPSEPAAANALRLGDSILVDAAHGRTAAALRALGRIVHTVDLSELAKAEGAVTCCSILIDV